MKVLHSWNCPFLRTWPFRGFPEDKLINPIFKSPLPGIRDEFLSVSRLGLPRVASFTNRNIREHLSVLTNLYKPPRPLWANARFSRLPIQFYDPMPFFIIRNSSFSFWFQTRTRALVDKMAFAQLGRSLSDKNCGQAIVDALKIRIQVFMYFTKSVIEKMVSCRYLGHTSLNHNMAEAHSKLTGGWTWRQVWRWKHKRTPPDWRLTPPPPASSCRCDGTSPNSRSIDTIQFRNQVN